MAAPDRADAQRFSSRLALVLSVLGIAVGTGNIWRFPRIVAQNGGEDGAGGFLLAWLFFLLVWSIPLIIAEYALGQRGRMGVIGTFVRLSQGKLAWMGAFVGFVAAAIMCYYAVVNGWCVYYFGTSLLGGLPDDHAAAMASWEAFQASGLPVAGLALAMGLGGLAVARGVGAIERISLVLLPTLLVIVLIAVVRAVTLPGAGEGLAYLFTPDLSVLARPRTWLEALTQNAWDTGAGWGLILTYAAYMKREHGVVRNAVLTGVGNNLVSVLAATMIFGTVFATLGATTAVDGEALTRLEVMQNSGPASTGLTFIWMPQLFAQMPFGRVLAVLFFLGLSFAAFTSLMSMIELSARALVDWGMKRTRAVAVIVGAGFLVGLPSALNLDVLGNQDFVWGVALMLSGAFIAFLVWRYGTRRLHAEIATPADWPLPRVWDVLIRWAVPLQAVVLLVWWMYLAATVYAPDSWYDPFDPYSVMTCLAQWGVVLLAFVLLNRWMARQIERAGPTSGPADVYPDPADAEVGISPTP